MLTITIVGRSPGPGSSRHAAVPERRLNPSFVATRAPGLRHSAPCHFTTPHICPPFIRHAFVWGGTGGAPLPPRHPPRGFRKATALQHFVPQSRHRLTPACSGLASLAADAYVSCGFPLSVAHRSTVAPHEHFAFRPHSHTPQALRSVPHPRARFCRAVRRGHSSSRVFFPRSPESFRDHASRVLRVAMPLNPVSSRARPSIRSLSLLRGPLLPASSIFHVHKAPPGHGAARIPRGTVPSLTRRCSASTHHPRS